MPKKSKFLILIIAETFFLILMFIVLPTVFIKERNGISQTSFENILPLDTNHTYTQSFISDRNNLNSVSIFLKNPGLKNHDYIFIEVQDNHYTTIQKLETSGVSIGDPSWIKLKFPPISSQKGDTFYIKVISNAKHDNDLYVYGNQENKNLDFKTTYKSVNLANSLKENLDFQKERFTNLNKTSFYLYLITIIGINIAILIL